MKFSVIIPVYNVEKYLPACLDSVQGQTFQDFETILVDDGSTDSSPVIAATYADGKENWHLIHQENQGLSGARNTGLVHAKGDYVLFLDSDDWLETNAFELLEKNLNGEDMVCFSGRRFFENNGQFQSPDQLLDHNYKSGMEYYAGNALLARDFAFVCVVLRAYRRMFLVANGLRFKEGVFHEDNLFTPLACFYAQRVKVINECLYDYRVRANSITTTRDMRRWRDLMGIANELAAFFITRKGYDRKTVFRSITHLYQKVFFKTLRMGEKEVGKLCDWSLYRIVSRTKIRHRVNYCINRIRSIV